MRNLCFLIYKCIFLILWTITTSDAQDYTISKNTAVYEIPGLSHVVGIENMIQDKNGFVWIATQSGLYKYDGYITKHYYYNPNEPNKLAGNWIMGLTEDDKGYIWIGVFGVGLQKFDPKTESFTLFKPDPNNPKALQSNLIVNLQFINKDLWITSQTGVERLSIIREEFISYPSRNYSSIVSLNSNIYYLSDNISKYNPKADTFELILPLENVVIRAQGYKNKIYFSKISGGTLYCYDIDKSEVKIIDTSQNGRIRDMLVIKDNLILWREKSKLEIYDIETSTLKPLPISNEIIEKTFSIDYGKLLKLKDDELWFGSNIILKVEIKSKGIETFEVLKSGKKNMLGRHTALNAYKNEKLGIAKSVIFDLEKIKVDPFSTTYKSLRNFPSEDDWFDSYIQQREDRNGNVWIAFYNSHAKINECFVSLLLFNPIKDKLEFITCLSGSNQLMGMAVNGEYVWIALWGKLIKYSINEKKSEIIRQTNDSTGLSSRFLRQIYIDKNGDIWIATQNGLNRIKKGQDTFIHYFSKPGDKNSLSSNVISTVSEDARGNILIGTIDGGLNIFNKKTETFSWYTTNEGLTNNSIINILVDNNERIWMTTGNNLAQLDHQTRKIINYFPSDGTLQTGYGEHASIKLTDGSLIFGGDGAFNRIRPELLNKPSPRSPIYITDVQLYNTSLQIDGIDSILHQHINFTKHLTFRHDQDVITLQYAALDMSRGSQCSYAYQLEGFDEDWQYVEQKREVTYTNLPANEYTFRVKCNNGSGEWFEMTTPLTITILPPWWQTWWAYSLYFVLIGGSIWSYINYRSKALKRENRILENKVHLRTEQLEKSLHHLKSTQAQLIQSEKMASLGELTAGIAHEIQNPLNFVNNFSELSVDLAKELKEEMDNSPLNPEGGITLSSKDKEYINEIISDLSSNQEKINHHGQRASSIVKGMLEHSRKSSGHKEPTDINALCDEYLRLTFNAFKSKDTSFNAVLKTSFDPNIPKIDIIPQDIGRVILNILTNAFYAVAERSKKGESGYEPTVSVSTKRVDTPSGTGGEPSKIEISINDNGSGIPAHIKDKIFHPFFTTKPTGQGTGLGLSLAYDIVKAHGGELLVNTEVEKGTAFNIKLNI